MKLRQLHRLGPLVTRQPLISATQHAGQNRTSRAAGQSSAEDGKRPGRRRPGRRRPGQWGLLPHLLPQARQRGYSPESTRLAVQCCVRDPTPQAEAACGPGTPASGRGPDPRRRLSFQDEPRETAGIAPFSTPPTGSFTWPGLIDCSSPTQDPCPPHCLTGRPEEAPPSRATEDRAVAPHGGQRRGHGPGPTAPLRDAVRCGRGAGPHANSRSGSGGVGRRERPAPQRGAEWGRADVLCATGPPAPRGCTSRSQAGTRPRRGRKPGGRSRPPGLSQVPVRGSGPRVRPHAGMRTPPSRTSGQDGLREDSGLFRGRTGGEEERRGAGSTVEGKTLHSQQGHGQQTRGHVRRQSPLGLGARPSAAAVTGGRATSGKV